MRKIFLIVFFMSLSVLAHARQAVAPIEPTAAGSQVAGEAVFTEEPDGVRVAVTVVNVTPGKHGFHIHENGSCDDAGKAAGGHFNPEGSAHGFLPEHGHGKAHPGDMGNIDVGPDGSGTLDLFLPKLNFDKPPYAILGLSVILHEKEDDFSQPTGNAGGRIGCGIIAIKEISDESDDEQ